MGKQSWDLGNGQKSKNRKNRERRRYFTRGLPTSHSLASTPAFTPRVRRERRARDGRGRDGRSDHGEDVRDVKIRCRFGDRDDDGGERKQQQQPPPPLIPISPALVKGTQTKKSSSRQKIVVDQQSFVLQHNNAKLLHENAQLKRALVNEEKMKLKALQLANEARLAAADAEKRSVRLEEELQMYL